MEHDVSDSVHHSWFDKRELEPLYAFGHGLSYSSFEYERLHIPCAEVSSDGLIQIDVDVRNVAGPAAASDPVIRAGRCRRHTRRGTLPENTHLCVDKCDTFSRQAAVVRFL